MARFAQVTMVRMTAGWTGDLLCSWHNHVPLGAGPAASSKVKEVGSLALSGLAASEGAGQGRLDLTYATV